VEPNRVERLPSVFRTDVTHLLTPGFLILARRQGIEPNVHARFWRPAASISYDAVSSDLARDRHRIFKKDDK
jgi:hypothetical protein